MENFGKICGLPRNSNFMLFNTIYQQSVGEERKDVLTLIFKNLETGEKFIKYWESPTFEVYTVKPNVDIGTVNRTCLSEDLLDAHTIRYKSAIFDAAKLLGVEKQCKNIMRTEGYKAAKDFIYLNNRLLGIDRNIEDYVRFEAKQWFGEKELPKMDCCFLDIETDIKAGYIDFKGGTGTAPINVLSITDVKTETIYTIINTEVPANLDDRNKARMERNIKDVYDRKDELKKDIEELNADVCNYQSRIFFAKNELETIKTCFNIINAIKPDICFIWNANFDFRYFVSRIEILGGDPKDIICHPDFDHKICKYIVDTRNFKVQQKTDHTIVSSYTLYVCQMILYGNIRKSRSAIDSFKLDFIGEFEAGIRKLEYEGHIRDFPYKDFYMFCLYNSRDTTVQLAINKLTDDDSNYFYRSYSSSTRFNKIFKETVFVINSINEVLRKKLKLILGTNVNAVLNGGMESKEKLFEGAIVGNPNLIEHIGEVLFGNHISNRLMRNVVDYDFTSLYPTIKTIINIFTECLIGAVRFENANIGKREQDICYTTDDDNNRIFNPHYTRGSKMMEDVECREALQILYRWANMPSVELCLELFAEYRHIDLAPSKTIVKLSRNKKKAKKLKVKLKRNDKRKVC